MSCSKPNVTSGIITFYKRSRALVSLHCIRINLAAAAATDDRKDDKEGNNIWTL